MGNRLDYNRIWARAQEIGNQRARNMGYPLHSSFAAKIAHDEFAKMTTPPRQKETTMGDNTCSGFGAEPRSELTKNLIREGLSSDGQRAWPFAWTPPGAERILSVTAVRDQHVIVTSDGIFLSRVDDTCWPTVRLLHNL